MQKKKHDKANNIE